MSKIYNQSFPVFQDYEDIYAKEIYIERADMILDKEEKISTKYSDNPTEDIWVTKKIGKNASGKVIYVKVVSVSNKTPDWISSSLLSA